MGPLFIIAVNGNIKNVTWGVLDMMLRFAAAALAIAGTFPAYPALATATEFEPLAQRCAPSVHPSTLSAIVWHESRYNPLAIGLNNTRSRLPRQPRSKAEAVATAQWLVANGYNFDSGLGQVNIRNVGWLGMSLDDLFDPCANLHGASRVLAACYGKALKAGLVGQPALHGALSCYNAGNLTRGISNGYVQSLAGHATLHVPVLMQDAPASPDARVLPSPSPKEPRSDDTAKANTTANGPQPAQPETAEPAKVEREGDADLFAAGDGDVFKPRKDQEAKKTQSPR